MLVAPRGQRVEEGLNWGIAVVPLSHLHPLNLHQGQIEGVENF